MPRHHAVNLASLGSDGVERLWRFVASFRERWEEVFGRVVAFEHGPATAGRPAGCGVDHAHLHLVPCGHLDAAERTLDTLHWSPVSDLSLLAAATDDCADYLYLRTATQQLAFVSPNIPSQALRQVIAAELGDATAFNWREHSNLDVVRTTIARAPR